MGQGGDLNPQSLAYGTGALPSEPQCEENPAKKVHVLILYPSHSKSSCTLQSFFDVFRKILPSFYSWVSLLWFLSFITKIRHISGILWSKITIDHSTDSPSKYKHILFYCFTHDYRYFRPKIAKTTNFWSFWQHFHKYDN